MKNKYFPDEDIEFDDLYFICFMIEKVARRLHQHNKYVVNKIGADEFYHLISCAQALHTDNPLNTANDWIENYGLKRGTFDITKVNPELAEIIPTPTQMGKVYARLISNTLDKNEDFVSGIMRVYNDAICDTIDNYNCSAFYEPSYVIAQAYREGGF